MNDLALGLIEVNIAYDQFDSKQAEWVGAVIVDRLSTQFTAYYEADTKGRMRQVFCFYKDKGMTWREI